jgi:alanine racemase
MTQFSSTPHHITVSVSRPTFAANIRQIRDRVSPAQVCIVMKANAYGHGLQGLAPTAVAAGADYLGICTNPEAATVRQLGLNVKLMRLRMAFPDEFEESLDHLQIEEQVGTWEAAEYLSAAGQKRERPTPVHINIDTGMGRSGFFPSELETLKQVCSLPGLQIVGIMTHFASADGQDLATTHHQLAAFEQTYAALQDELPAEVLVHTHNSAATVRLTQHCNHGRCRTLVRVGAAAYGVRTSQEFANFPELKPVMQVKTRVAQVRKIPAGKPIGYGGLFTTQRDSLIASLPVGFGEGYPRSLFNKGIVLIQGHRCPVVGRVSLNITTVDVTDLPHPVQWGDEAVLVGQQGEAEVTFEELADKFNSVHTEINLMAGLMNPVRYVG